MVGEQLGLSVSDMRIGVTPPKSIVLLNAAPLPDFAMRLEFSKISTLHQPHHPI